MDKIWESPAILLAILLPTCTCSLCLALNQIIYIRVLTALVYSELTALVCFVLVYLHDTPIF